MSSVTSSSNRNCFSDNFFCMTILMYVAVMQPIFYKTRLKLKHLLFTGWGLALVGTTIGVRCFRFLCCLKSTFSRYYLDSSQRLFFSHRIASFHAQLVRVRFAKGHLDFRANTLQYPFAISTLILLCIAYLLMVICYFIIIVRLRKRIHILVSSVFMTEIFFFVFRPCSLFVYHLV